MPPRRRTTSTGPAFTLFSETLRENVLLGQPDDPAQLAEALRLAVLDPDVAEMPLGLETARDGDAWWTEVDGRELRLSNLNKIFWPDEGYTKGDLLAYYWNIAGLIGPHLEGRPLTMKRMPDGAEGPHFYEKTAPSHTPDWVHRCEVHSDD